MNRTIFYSWQSDLPNNSNRGFIESCLKAALKKIKNTCSFSLDLNIDRDTKDVSGTPDITESIFSKISRSKIFIADISIINSDSKGRKCPNPNVLIELGYAAKVLGWNRVFCIYNTDFGSISDLPFDLRQRRPMLYSIVESGKAMAKERLTESLANAILQLSINGELFDEVDDYLKQKIDTQVLTIVGHLGKMLFGYHEHSVTNSAQRLGDITDEQIKTLITNGPRLGFQIFKHFEVQEHHFRNFADHIISSAHHSRELAAAVIRFVSWCGRHHALTSPRSKIQWFTELPGKTDEYNLAPPSAFAKNDALPDRYALIRKLDAEKGIIVDFGDFSYKQHLDKLLTFHQMKVDCVDAFTKMIRDFINTMNQWLDNTNGEFILDTYHNFEIQSNNE